MTDAPRLIEAAFPVAAVGRHARREKSLRHGHPATLHTWWSRKPLGASRATVLAALWPDPASPACPPAFRAALASALGGRADDGRDLQGRACAFLADFARWEHSASAWHLDTARALVAAAHAAEGGAGRPLVVDPFAGGGSIPLEALRVGADTVASDLNPVATLLCRTLLEEVPGAGPQLADGVRRAGAALLERAAASLAPLYPPADAGDHPLVYLWCRTARCTGCGVEIPLLSKRLLEDTQRRRVGVRLETTPGGIGVRLVSPEEMDAGGGTVRNGNATCPCCGTVLPPSELRRQLSARGGGTADARLLAVVTQTSDGRRYRLPHPQDAAGIARARAALAARLAEDPAAVPTEPLPPAGTLGFSVRPYGFSTWGDLFAPRQALALATFSRLVRELPHATQAERAVATCLALAVDRQADYLSALCRWHTTRALVNNTFGRQAISMVWDFAECQPLADGPGGFAGAVAWVAKVCEGLAAAHLGTGRAVSASAERLPLPAGVGQAVVTDPPHWDAVPYADISEFFYVWLRRSARDLHPDLLAANSVPRGAECVNSRVGGKDDAHYERTLTAALTEARRVLAPPGVAVVIFAQRARQGWAAFGRALAAAGWQVTASWTVATEMGARLRAKDSAVLGTTVQLVLRPGRGTAAAEPALARAEISRGVEARLPDLEAAGLSGLDAIASANAVALQVWGRYAPSPAWTVEEALETAAGVSAALAIDQLLAGAPDPAAHLAARWALGAGWAPVPPARAREFAAAAGTDLDQLVGSGQPWERLANGRLAPVAALTHGAALGTRPATSALGRLHQAMARLAADGSGGLAGFLGEISAGDALWGLGQALLALRCGSPEELRLLAAVLARRGGGA